MNNLDFSSPDSIYEIELNLKYPLEEYKYLHWI